MKNKKGISLIVLAITIIVMIILAGVVIISVNNTGVLNSADSGKNNTEIASEIETLNISLSQVMLNSISTSTTKDGLEQVLNKNLGENGAEVIDCGKYIVVKYIKSNRHYKVELNGKVAGKLEVNQYEYAGDLTKNEQFDGTELKPYKISCIEDLVEWSKNATSYTGYIELTQDLDFLDVESYNDYATEIYGDLNNDGKVSSLMAELIDEKGTGFTPISILNGTFDGNNHEIQNIYINRTSNAALILSVANNSVIKDFGITGKITSTEGYASGILASSPNKYTTISNCHNSCNVTAKSNAGGILASFDTTTQYEVKVKIENSYNTGNITSEGVAGGIIGTNNYQAGAEVYNCYNTGDIYAAFAGGIVGGKHLGKYLIYNSYNSGKITGNNVGGIVGRGYNSELSNLYNVGVIDALSTTKGAGIINWEYHEVATEKCYYLDNVKVVQAVRMTGAPVSTVGNKMTSEYLKSEEFLKVLNDEVRLNDGWAYWITGEDGYPVLDFNNINKVVTEPSEQ